VVHFVADISGEFAHINYIVSFASANDFSRVLRLSSTFGIEDGLIENYVLVIFDGNDVSVTFFQVAVLQIQGSGHGFTKPNRAMRLRLRFTHVDPRRSLWFQRFSGLMKKCKVESRNKSFVQGFCELV
jgi:hypothetical protein